MLKYLLLVCLFIVNINSSLVSAQNNVEFKKKNFKQDKKGFKLASQDIIDGDIYFPLGKGAHKIAILFYKRANKFNPNNAELNLKIGKCLLHTDDNDKALPYIKKSLKLYGEEKSHAKFYLADFYHFDYKFDKAVKIYQEFVESLPSDDKSYYKIMAGKRISECKNGIKFLTNPIETEIKNLGKDINTDNVEYSPVISANEDTLYFTARRKLGNSEKEIIDSTDFNFFEDVYTAMKSEGNDFKIINVGSKYNWSEHDALICSSGSKEVIYRSTQNGDLYIKINKGADDFEIKAFPKAINSEYQESSGVLSSDGNTLYFISNKLINNKGGKDIFFSEKNEKGKWKRAKNIGAVINTKYDEDGLFLLSDDKTLYFSSKGHDNMGGFDIFKTYKKSDGTWAEPKNLGYPINTTADDIHFTIAGNGKHGYYASDKKGGFGMHDIYSFTITDDICYRNILKGIVTDYSDNKPLDATVLVYTAENELVFDSRTDSKGNYESFVPAGKKHSLIVNSLNHLFYNEKFDVEESKDGFVTITKNIKLKKAEKGSETILNAIEFDFASDKLRKSSFASLNNIVLFMISNPSIKVEISGHTDNKGEHDFNKNLSENRAKAVVIYLISQKVPGKNLIFKGYSFDKPIATNDTEEGRQQNRRVEFKITAK